LSGHQLPVVKGRWEAFRGFQSRRGEDVLLSLPGSLIGGAREQKRQQGMKSARGPEQVAYKTCANSEIAKINSGEQIVDEQGESGLRGGVIAARPTRQPKGEQPQPGQPGDCDAAVGEADA